LQLIDIASVDIRGDINVASICFRLGAVRWNDVYFSKIGIRKTDSNLATALRTIIVLLFSWLMVFVVGSQYTIGTISARSLVF
jgi:uncharacterized membrane protein